MDRNLSEASKDVHGTEDVRTRVDEARCMQGTVEHDVAPVAVAWLEIS